MLQTIEDTCKNRIQKKICKYFQFLGEDVWFFLCSTTFFDKDLSNVLMVMLQTIDIYVGHMRRVFYYHLLFVQTMSFFVLNISTSFSAHAGCKEILSVRINNNFKYVICTHIHIWNNLSYRIPTSICIHISTLSIYLLMYNLICVSRDIWKATDKLLCSMMVTWSPWHKVTTLAKECLCALSTGPLSHMWDKRCQMTKYEWEGTSLDWRQRASFV